MTREELRKDFGYNLKRKMKEYGISQTELSQVTGVCPSTLSRYIYGEMIPTLPNLINLSLALDCDITDLIDNDEKIE